MRAITARETRLSVEDGTAGRYRPERNILAIALLIILVLQVSTTYRLEEVRNAETKSCQCRAAKAVSGAVEDGWHKEWIGRRSFYFISEPFFEAVLMTRHTTSCSL